MFIFGNKKIDVCINGRNHKIKVRRLCQNDLRKLKDELFDFKCCFKSDFATSGLDAVIKDPRLMREPKMEAAVDRVLYSSVNDGLRIIAKYVAISIGMSASDFLNLERASFEKIITEFVAVNFGN